MKTNDNWKWGYKPPIEVDIDRSLPFFDKCRSFWSMRENGASPKDLVGRNDGYIANGCYINDGCLVFPNSNSITYFGNIPVPTTNEVTLMGRVFIPSWDGWLSLFGQSQNSSPYSAFWIRRGPYGPILSTVVNSSGVQYDLYNYNYNGNGYPVENAWHTLFLTYDGTTHSFYIDGVLVASGSASGPLFQPYAQFTMGDDYSYGGRGAPGMKIDVAGYWDRHFSHDEILIFSNDTNAIYEPPPHLRKSVFTVPAVITPKTIQTISTTGNQPQSANNRVGVVVNLNDPDSVAIGAYYLFKRPGALLCPIACIPGMSPLAYTEFNANVLAPINTWLSSNPGVDFLVTTKGISAQVDSQAGGGGSIRSGTDSVLMACMHTNQNLTLSGFTKSSVGQFLTNDYYTDANASVSSHAPFPIFSRSTRGYPLITRLDGSTRNIALQMIDNSMNAKPWHGISLFNPGGNNNGANVDLNSSYDPLMYADFKALIRNGNKHAGVIDQSNYPQAQWKTFYNHIIGWTTMGLYSGDYSQAKVSAMKFLPGCIMYVYNSYSGFTLFTNTTYGHLQPESLVPQGITGASCSVEEPYGEYPSGHILFDMYHKGFSLAESFWASIPVLGGVSCIIGDPICAPYHS